MPAPYATMGHGHDHGHAAHAHPHASATRAFASVTLINLAYTALEAGYGFHTNSLALLSDALHNLGDVLGLALAWSAAAIARRPPRGRHTYGWRRATLLSPLANAVLLMVFSGALGWEAFRRFSAPPDIPATPVIVVAALGILVNLGAAWLVRDGHAHDLNKRGAFLHLMADAAVSLAAVLAGVGMATLGWAWLDPATALLIAVVVAVGSWRLLRDSFDAAMDAVPGSVDPDEVGAFLRAQPGVAAVHHLPHLVAGRQRDRPDRASGAAARGRPRCLHRRHRARPGPPFRHQPRHPADRARRRLRPRPARCGAASFPLNRAAAVGNSPESPYNRPFTGFATERAMLNDIKKDAQARMAKSIDALRHTLVKVRTGRASTALVEHLKVNYYGSDVPLSQVATVAISDSRSLTITPWEKQIVGAVEKAILASDLGLTPNTAGTTIRLNLPALTEERRKELSKVVARRGRGQQGGDPHIRRDANQAGPRTC